MSTMDAPAAVAKREHLGNDDALRITGLLTDKNGEVQQMRMQAILVRDVPLEAWVAMLRDPNNIFGKEIFVEKEGSALAVMKAFPELELSAENLAEGVKGLVAAVIPYIKDKEAQRSVQAQYEMLHSNQQEIHAKASSIADRWLAFEIELAESLRQERATPYIQDFIAEFDGIWGDATAGLLARQRLSDGSVYMTRELAVKIEQVRTKTLWIKASVANNNRAITEQMDSEVVSRILAEEAKIQAMYLQGYAMYQILAADSANNHVAAQQAVKGASGCPGEIDADIRTTSREQSAESDTANGKVNLQGAETAGQDKDCAYKHTGCYCCPYDDYGRPLPNRIEVMARRDSNGV
ncbi:MAG: hypothetical protein AAB834_00020, partial [Patescibacteria group bacterium]